MCVRAHVRVCACVRSACFARVLFLSSIRIVRTKLHLEHVHEELSHRLHQWRNTTAASAPPSCEPSRGDASARDDDTMATASIQATTPAESFMAPNKAYQWGRFGRFSDSIFLTKITKMAQ